MVDAKNPFWNKVFKKKKESSLVSLLLKLDKVAPGTKWKSVWQQRWRTQRLLCLTSLFFFFFKTLVQSTFGSAGIESACNVGDLSSIHGLGRSSGEGKGYPFQHSGLENSMECIVRGIAKRRTQLNDFHFSLFIFQLTFYFLYPQCPSLLIHVISSLLLPLLWLLMVHAQSLQLCPTLCDPMDCSPPGSPVHGIFQTRILEWVAVPSSRGFSWPRDQTWAFCVSCIAGGFFIAESLGKPPNGS